MRERVKHSPTQTLVARNMHDGKVCMPLSSLCRLLNCLKIYLLRNSLNPDQTRRYDGPGRFVGPSLGPKCLQMRTLVGKELKTAIVHLISYCLCFSRVLYVLTWHSFYADSYHICHALKNKIML